MRAARMLNDAVEKYLHQSVPAARTARIVVKIYADLTNLSKNLAKTKLIGMEKRSVAPFSAGLTRAMSLFDFVDALDEDGCKFKISGKSNCNQTAWKLTHIPSEQFKIASEDSACSHIFYAACHDSTYLSQLVPFSGVRDKITLVQGAGWNNEFHKLHLNVTQFPTVFRWSELQAPAPSNKTLQSSGNVTPRPKLAPKKDTYTAPLGPYLGDSWRSLSARSSIIESEGYPNGFGASNGVGTGSKPAKTKKPSLPCKYFQKVSPHLSL